MIFTKAFALGLLERAVKTFAQALVAIIGAGTVGLLDVDWLQALSVAGLATLASVLTSIGNANFTAGDDAEPPADSIDDTDVEEEDPVEDLDPVEGDDPDAYVDAPDPEHAA